MLVMVVGVASFGDGFEASKLSGAASMLTPGPIRPSVLVPAISGTWAFIAKGENNKKVAKKPKRLIRMVFLYPPSGRSPPGVAHICMQICYTLGNNIANLTCFCYSQRTIGSWRSW